MKDIIKLIESLNEEEDTRIYGPYYKDFIDKISKKNDYILKCLQFGTNEDGMGDFEIFDLNDKYIGSIYNNTEDRGYILNLKLDKLKPIKNKVFKNIDDLIDYLSDVINSITD